MAGADAGDSMARAWNMGTLARRKSEQKTDTLTGSDWNEGIAGNNNGTATSTFTETIGGDDVTDWVRFRVKFPVRANLVTDNAIAAIVNSSRSVVVDSSDGYSNNPSATLLPGVYFLQFSSEPSIPA